MKVKIGGVIYDTESATRLAHKATPSSDQQLFQTADGDFFLFSIQMCVDGRKLDPEECWVDLGKGRVPNSRLTFSESITALTHKQALEWCIKTQIPKTLRGYFLDTI